MFADWLIQLPHFPPNKAYIKCCIVLIGHSELQHFNQAHQDHQPFFIMDDPTIQLDAQGEVRRLKVTVPEVDHYLEIEEVSGLDIIAELTEEDLEEEFNKLSVSDKIKYNEWVQFHQEYQQTHGIAGTSSQIIRYISNLNKPAIPKDFEDTNPASFDASLMKITTGLQQAAEGYEELRNMIPTTPVTDIPKLLEETPLPYLTPLLKEMVQALQSVGKERLADLRLHEEHRRGTSQVSLMLKYGVMRNRLHKVIMGTSRPGGSQYQK